MLPDADLVRFRVSPEKAKEWAHGISCALKEKCLRAGAASKLAGRLAFATGCTFRPARLVCPFVSAWASTVLRRLGRAMIKPIYRQQYSRNGEISATLDTALRWWLHVLESGLAEQRPWTQIHSQVIRMYVDAASTPAHCAAVVSIGGHLHYTDGPPDRAWVSTLQRGRQDNQIMSLVRPDQHLLSSNLSCWSLLRNCWR